MRRDMQAFYKTVDFIEASINTTTKSYSNIYEKKKFQRTESTGLIFLTVIFSLGGKSMFNTFYEVSSSYYKKTIIELKYTLS